MPITLYGSAKQKYPNQLHKELVYHCLEPGADLMPTQEKRNVLSEDGKYYSITGQKMDL
jgi:hypothetical protein